MSNEDNPVRIAVVGTGFIGRRHIEFLRQTDGLDAVAAADPAPDSGPYLAGLNVPHFTDYNEMFDKVKPEGVVVATPNNLHEVVAIAAMERGIPVLIEKPVAHSLESARNIVETARRTGVPTLVGHHRRHNPLMRAARDFIQGGGIGKVISVSAQHLRRKPDSYYDVEWKKQPGGGPVLINGIHEIDCLRFMCGEIESLMAFTGNAARGNPVEDAASVSFRFESGALGNLTLSDAVQAPWAWETTTGEESAYHRQVEECFLVCGMDGSLSIPTLTHWRNEKGGGRMDPFICKQIFYTPANPWVEELKHFGAMIRDGEASLLTAEDGMRTLAATLAILLSAEDNAPIDIAKMK